MRRAAVSALRGPGQGHAYADSLIERRAEKSPFVLRSVFAQSHPDGCVAESQFTGSSDRAFRRGKLDSETRDVLRVGFCQLLILRIPDHAAIYETVECARKPVQGLINAVLRKAAQTRMRLLGICPRLSCLSNTRIRIGFETMAEAFGKDKAVALMDWNNLRPRLFIAAISSILRPKELPCQMIPGKRFQEDIIISRILDRSRSRTACSKGWGSGAGCLCRSWREGDSYGWLDGKLRPVGLL